MALSEDYILKVISLRKQKKLHTTVEEALAALLKKAIPDSQPVAEVCGLAGGRRCAARSSGSSGLPEKSGAEVFGKLKVVQGPSLVLHWMHYCVPDVIQSIQVRQ